MRSLSDHMASYGAHHRDPRNRATHYVGVPLIILGVLLALSLPRWEGVTPAMALVAGCGLYYLALDLRLGLALLAPALLILWGADELALQAPAVAGGAAAAALVLGWAMQVLGHRFEGNRPALLARPFLAVVSPIFLLAEAAFALGWREELRKQVASRLRMGDYAAARRGSQNCAGGGRGQPRHSGP